MDWPECEIMYLKPCQSACDVQVWSTGTVVNGEGHAGSCRWTESDQGRALDLTEGSESPGDQQWWLTLRTCTRARTWWSRPCCRRDRGLVGHVSMTWWTRTRCDTHDSFSG
jgi:hypothetical protein